MGLTETLLFYLVVGISVAVAVWVQSERRPWRERALRTATAVPFWPVFVPVLLESSTGTGESTSPPLEQPSEGDDLSRQIAEVERELDAALSSLDGWAEEALSHERERIVELRAAWTWQAERIREMDVVLREIAAPAADAPPVSEEAWESPACPAHQECDAASDRIQLSERSRRENYERLHKVREQAHADLTATLSRVRELVSLIHLARFTGAPASRADELVFEIAASIEGLSEVAGWPDRPRTEPVASTPRSRPMPTNA
jgi:hypothetical protein